MSKIKSISYNCFCALFFVLSSQVHALENLQDSKISEDKQHNQNTSGGDLLKLVKESPEVFEVLNDVNLSEWEIAKIKSESGFQFSASSSGGYSIASNIPRTHRKYSQEKNFLDLRLNLSKKLFDSGVSSARIQAEKKRKIAKALQYNKVVRNTFFAALRIGYLTLSAEEQLINIDQAIEAVKNHRKSEEKRYLSGTGTSANLKELDLLAIDLITEKQLKSLEIETFLSEFENRFEANLRGYLDDIQKHNVRRTESKIEEIIALLDATRIFDYQLDALDQDIVSSQNSNRPQLSLNVTTNIYDVESDELKNYDINGGLNLDVPIFDSGLKENQVRALSTRKKILKFQKQKEADRILTQTQNINKTIENSLDKIEASEFKINQILLKLKQLQLRSSNMVASGLEIARAEYRIFALKREKLSLNWNVKLSQAERALLKETLISDI